MNIKNGPDESWREKIISYNLHKDNLQIYIESRSSIHVIIGKTDLGNYVCIHNFKVEYYLPM